ncbi:response regulator transcription factor [Christiangramia sp. SM2212]|uniref:Response regulator transcription factor n=1 Tax=Christiangramia sediminicola TaxID=3073267 RepID=A0ABU1ENI6_9FLAO|nr:response regulator transcription factor [Christiangramia sp. SM2212]MDR5589607.1 response regulator transcription factor [Christiangramia sp. SM2212]
MDKRNKILLVEDDESLGYLLSEYLKIKDFDVSWAKNGEIALKNLENHNFHLVVLDVMLPDIDGFNLAKKIKIENPKTPFIFLTARSLKVDVLKGFSLGAMDYLKKPIDEEELVTRIEVLISRLHPSDIEQDLQKEIHQIGAYVFDSKNQKLIFENEETVLTARENELLLYLLKNRNQLCAHKDILDLLWGKNDYFNRKSLNVFISRLRKYLKSDPTIKIRNLHKKGFVLRVED